MGLVNGPFQQTMFCGASVISFSSSVGWNQESSSITVNLVEDKGQSFTFPAMGTPQAFNFDGFHFEGLVQRWLEKNGIDGKPVFEVTLTDPREILSGAQIILSSYRGGVGDFKNLLNAFGYWENLLGFGGSLSNESGMVWNAPFEILGVTSDGGGININPVATVGILPAIHSMTNGAGGIFGGALSFRGHNYNVDLSSLPTPPAYYRMGGVSSNILDMVSQICQDGGHDYICLLKDHTITFRCVSRQNPGNDGQISNFIFSRQDVASNSIGIEMRNDVTNAILLGGDVCELIQEYNFDGGKTIWPYWGLDNNSGVIMGEGNPDEGNHKFDLNAAPIADIMGSLIYPCDIPELRFALIDFDSWSAYVLKYYPKKAKVIELVSAIDSTSELQELFPDVLFMHDMIAERDEESEQFGKMNESEYWTNRAQKVYEFVRTFASEYFGKKFLVKIPFFIYWKFEEETTHRISTHEPTDGGFFPEGGLPLGLNFLNESMFLTEDGRFQCFVKMTNAKKADIQKLSPDSAVIQDDDIYVKASVDSEVGIVYPQGSVFPYVVITLDSQVYETPVDPLGNVKEIAKMLEVTPESIAYAAGNRHGSFPIKIHPAPYRPTGVALPMKSNMDSYGPWYTSGGIDGKVSFERDEGMVPWTYGDLQTMELAAKAKLANAATSMQHQETGTVEIAGSPDHSLGDELIGGGPQLTGIDVSVGQDGVRTTYRMQTFTPRFGSFTKDNADRLRRMGIGAMQMRRSIRNLYQRQKSYQRLVASAQMGFMANTSRAVSQRSPHWCLLGNMTYSEKYGYRTQVSTQSAQEAVANARGDNDDKWQATSCMSLEGLLRPFSTRDDREEDDPANDMPHYIKVDEEIDYPVTVDTLNPFGEYVDVDFLAYGDEYPGRMHTLKQQPEYENMRPVGLRGPLIQVGWGYTYTGKPVPNADDTDPLPEIDPETGEEIIETDPNTGEVIPPTLPEKKKEHELSDEFFEKHRMHPEKWKAGPIGLYWDNWRGLWTIPTILFGKMDADMTSEGALMSIHVNESILEDKVKVYGWLGGTIKANMKVAVIYYQQENTWQVISTECPSST